jgi:AcrR family transcriptional regulator
MSASPPKPRTRTKPARKPSQERAVATVDAILEAAARILEREGLGPGFGTNRIAREAGVSIGSLYEYFDGREAIVRALCDRHIANVRALIDTMFDQLAEASLEHAVEVFIDSLFALHESRPELQRTLHLDLSPRLGLRSMIDSDRYVETRLVEWLGRLYPSADREELSARAFVVVRAARGVTIHSFAEGLSPEARARVRASVKQLTRQTLGG